MRNGKASTEQTEPESRIANQVRNQIAAPDAAIAERHVANIARDRHATRLTGNDVGNLNWAWIRGSNLIKRIFG